jgi:hypothetical protein
VVPPTVSEEALTVEIVPVVGQMGAGSAVPITERLVPTVSRELSVVTEVRPIDTNTVEDPAVNRNPSMEPSVA